MHSVGDITPPVGGGAAAAGSRPASAGAEAVSRTAGPAADGRQDEVATEGAGETQNRPPFTLEGWFVLHDFRRLDWRRWKSLEIARRAAIAREAAAFLRRVTAAADTGEGASALYRVVGHKADLLWLHFRPTLEALSDLEAALSRTALGDYLQPAYSYVSVTELSFYRAGPGGPERDVRHEPFVRGRLYPAIPPARHACFYPMNKKRSGADNWYLLPFEERGRLMHSHGLIGRKYAGRVTQIISGSVGLDDWEWGVTLFADDPVDFKRVVYEMRFDEASARYGEFGPFYVGVRTDPDDLVRFLCPEAAGEVAAEAEGR
ncbi:hydrogen peroxide-dependent heme synthase [Thermaerobacter composti]|uniref:Coproheme decarboxylase n=1 Tax=Thermaerobacter composti TaxID=554949 RepID=A0ABZ0QST8_9FIRM|nr:hydrogen peroxide-dependent heme synthase [Thermaerobacter composti]PZN07542.1 MAG: heme-dependent peroxidase [Bacillota bacterium]WPD19518.1 heme-dependent peroxidase [Thermaerobacter composti]